MHNLDWWDPHHNLNAWQHHMILTVWRFVFKSGRQQLPVWVQEIDTSNCHFFAKAKVGSDDPQLPCYRFRLVGDFPWRTEHFYFMPLFLLVMCYMTLLMSVTFVYSLQQFVFRFSVLVLSPHSQTGCGQWLDWWKWAKSNQCWEKKTLGN